MYKILIVEDDTTISSVLERHLTQWGYSVAVADDFQAVLDLFQALQPHLVLLDITLPFYNGYYWCEQIRKRSRIPILFLSSASDAMNQVMAINMGADDFIAKPFHLDVMTAKIQALLRRAYSFGTDANLVQFGDIILNLSESTLLFDSKTSELTKNETKILQLLMEAKGSIVEREDIMRKLWEDESFIDDNTLTVNITRLRKKLADIDLAGFIVTKKGVGYYAQL